VDLRQLTRENKMLGAAGAMVLFIITLFLKWYGEGPFDVSGTDIDSWWLALIIAIVGGGVLAADALNVEIPGGLKATAVGTYLISLTLFYVVIFIVSGSGLSYGIFLALIFTLIGTGLALSAWREDRR
jgi:hypothetical protein